MLYIFKFLFVFLKNAGKFTQSSSRFFFYPEENKAQSSKRKESPSSNILMWERAEKTVLFSWAAKEKTLQVKTPVHNIVQKYWGARTSTPTHINLLLKWKQS